MARLSKEDLAQMNRDYFQSLEKARLVEVANNLHLYAVEQWEKINSDSSNSSRPPSADDPFREPKKSSTSISDTSQGQSNLESDDQKRNPQQQRAKKSKQKRKPGKQKGSKGFGRSQILKVDVIVPHHPNQCHACNQTLSKIESKPYMGHHVLELKITELGLKIICQLHHYYQTTCNCGHQTKLKPGEGITSTVEGRTRNLKLTEYVLVGSSLATLIASLGIRYRLSRAKILEFLLDWLGVELHALEH